MWFRSGLVMCEWQWRHAMQKSRTRCVLFQRAQENLLIHPPGRQRQLLKPVNLGISITSVTFVCTYFENITHIPSFAATPSPLLPQPSKLHFFRVQSGTAPSLPNPHYLLKMRSGSGVLCISACQLIVGLCLLGIYEGYKAYYFDGFLAKEEKAIKAGTRDEIARVSTFESPLDSRSPMGFSYYMAIFNNMFAVFGLAGVINAQRELIIGFFGYNAMQMVIAFHYFVDLCTDVGIKYDGEPSKLTSFERAAATFIFFSFTLSLLATVFAVKAIDEVKNKQREEFNRLAVLSDTLQYEVDHP